MFIQFSYVKEAELSDLNRVVGQGTDIAFFLLITVISKTKKEKQTKPPENK